MIFEDLHWIDPTSLEALKRSVDQIKALSAVLIVTFRPEFVAPCEGQSTSIILNRLGERDVANIVASLAGSKELPADVLAEIVERTDGIPLFVEEMTKAVLEAQSESAARKTTAAIPSSSMAVPEKVTGAFGWFGVGKTYQIEKGHLYFVGEFSGTFLNDKGDGSLFDKAGVKCPAFYDID